MSISTDKTDWYQTENKVIINYFKKNLDPDDVKLEMTNQLVSIYIISLPDDKPIKQFQLVDLIIPESSCYRVTSMKIEITLMKAKESKWMSLELTSPIKKFSDIVHSYPSSCKSSHDWDKIEKEAKEMEDDKDPLDKLFENIYASATDDTRKAMVKSFTESRGTVLSTNWSEVGSGKVEVKPPDGVEFKKFEL